MKRGRRIEDRTTKKEVQAEMKIQKKTREGREGEG